MWCHVRGSRCRQLLLSLGSCESNRVNILTNLKAINFAIHFLPQSQVAIGFPYATEQRH